MFYCFSTQKKCPPALKKFKAPLAPMKIKYKQHPNRMLEAISQRSPQQSTNSKYVFKTNNGIGLLKTTNNKTMKDFDSILQENIEQQQEENNVEQRKEVMEKETQQFNNIQARESKEIQTVKLTSQDYDECNVGQMEERSAKIVIFKQTHSFEDICSPSIDSRIMNSFSVIQTDSGKNRSQLNTFNYYEQLNTVNVIPEESAITLDNFHIDLKKVQISHEQEWDLPLDESTGEAQNDFYCLQAGINQQFSRAIIAYHDSTLAKVLFQKMNEKEKNKIDSRGYTPIQIVILKALKNQYFLEMAKQMIYQKQINLECRSPGGWTALQETLLYRNIPLSTHLFKAGYMKRQLQFQSNIEMLKEVLLDMPDFSIEVNVKVDSFLPLIGALTPDDTLTITKIGGTINVDYTLVGYSFPFCKRRKMSLYFDGIKMFGINHSKNIYCDLFESLDSQQMILLIQDLLVSQIKKGEPIVHEIHLNKCLSLFDNQIIQNIGGFQAVKYQLDLRYTSTAERRKINDKNKQTLEFVSDYGDYTTRTEEIFIKQKNKNKKVQLEVWLAPQFGIDLFKFVKVLETLGAGNNLLSKWAGFLKQKVGSKLTQGGLFPVKIDVPLDYSLYFNIQFHNFSLLQSKTSPSFLDEFLKKVSRKMFQSLHESKQKRKLFLEAYT